MAVRITTEQIVEIESGRSADPASGRTTEEKLDDLAALHAVTGTNRAVSLHVPWDDRPTPRRCGPTPTRPASAEARRRDTVATGL